MSEPARRIVIIKRPVKAAGHHGGGWKIAYADFMTAMFAFFLVMWLLSSSTPKQLTGIAEHFKMPLNEALKGGPAINNSPSVIPGGGDPGKPVDVVQQPDGESASDTDDLKQLDALKQQLEAVLLSFAVGHVVYANHSSRNQPGDQRPAKQDYAVGTHRCDSVCAGRQVLQQLGALSRSGKRVAARVDRRRT